MVFYELQVMTETVSLHTCCSTSFEPAENLQDITYPSHVNVNDEVQYVITNM
jgi:hypothetical protein